MNCTEMKILFCLRKSFRIFIQLLLVCTCQRTDDVVYSNCMCVASEFGGLDSKSYTEAMQKKKTKQQKHKNEIPERGHLHIKY